MAKVAAINWGNAITLISVAILVGTELVGAGAAAGWAIGGLFQLGEAVTRMLEGVLILTALTGLFYFLRAAVAHEPIAASWSRAGQRRRSRFAIALRTEGSPIRGSERPEHRTMPERQ